MSETIGSTVAALDRWVPELLPDAARAARILAAVHTAAPDATAPLTTPLLDEVMHAAWTESRHLELVLVPDGSLVPDDEHPGWPTPDLRGIRRRAGGVRSVSRDDDGVCTIAIDALDPFDVAEPYLDATVALADRATALVLDLRANGGGDPETVAFLAGFVLGGPAQHLSDVHGADGVTAWHSHELPGRHLATDAPVAVLTSARTFSSAEALAYHLQVRGRVIVIGERTPGGADHMVPIVLTPHVRALLPVARVVDVRTGTSWEGTGVEPDIECAADEAPARAREWLASAR